MLGTIARLALLRFLPRRLVPVLAAWEFISLLRGRRNRTSQADDPREPRAVSRRRR